MKLTVLLDNNTLIDHYFLAEPGVSYLIEDRDKQILFDVGYSDAFIQNANKLAVDLRQSDYVVLSHGHLDHTWGLDPLVKIYMEAKIEQIPFSRPVLLGHPLVFHPKIKSSTYEIGSLLGPESLSPHFDLKLQREPFWLTDKLVYLGEIERKLSFENQHSVGQVLTEGEKKEDFLLDDTALAYKSDQGLVIITGCSHAGICNIVEYAKKICKEDKVVDVIGGFHLLDPSQEQMEGTLAYFKKLKPDKLHACHCVDLASKIALAGVANLKEVGVGLSLEYF